MTAYVERCEEHRESLEVTDKDREQEYTPEMEAAEALVACSYEGGWCVSHTPAFHFRGQPVCGVCGEPSEYSELTDDVDDECEDHWRDEGR